MKIVSSSIPLLLILFISLNSVKAQENETITLDQAIKLAVENNPNIALSDADIDISKAVVKQAKSAYYPQISSRIIVPFIGRESGFYLDQLIWDFGRTSNRVKSTKAIVESSNFRKDQTQDDLILDSIIYYYTVLSDIHIINSLQKKVVEAEKRLDRTTVFFQSERASEIEVAKSEAELANVKLDLIKANNNLEISKLNLKTVMGKKHTFNFELEDISDYKKVIFDLEESIEQALNTHPELKGLLAQKVSKNANLEVAEKEFYPEIFGRTAYRFEGKGANTPGFIAGVGIKFPIFEGFSRFGKVQEAKAGIRKNKAELDIARANIIAEVNESYLDLKFAEENIIITLKAKQSAETTLLFAKERYQQDRASDLELAEAESIYEESITKYKQALYTYYINVAKLERATGEIYEPQE